MDIVQLLERPSRYARNVEGPKLVIGEGSHDAHFFRALLGHLGRKEIQTGHYDGRANLRAALKALANLRGAVQLRALGITCDADRNPKAAFTRVCTALRNAGYTVPADPGEFTAGPGPGLFSEATLRLGVFVMPDNQSKGMMETLCLRTVEDEPAMECVRTYFDCLRKKGVDAPRKNREHKAHAHAWMASRPDPDTPPGMGGREAWNFDSPALEPLKRFLSAL